MMATRENNKFALCVKHDIYESDMDAIDDIVERVMDILREEKLTHNEAEYVLAVCGENLRYEARLAVRTDEKQRPAFRDSQPSRIPPTIPALPLWFRDKA